MKILENIPNILYKYRVWEDPNHKRVLTDNELYFPSADQFNDPFDASLPIRYIKKELTKENIIKKLVQIGRNVQKDISEEELLKRAEERYKNVDFNSDDYWRNVDIPMKEKLYKTFGIYSLASQNDNILMWLHYANSHMGFCIGFDKVQLFESIRGLIAPVSYSDDFPLLSMPSSLDGSREYLLKILTTKSTHWKYEDEYRITKFDASKKTFQLKDEAIKEVIFGCKISIQSRKEIIEIVKSKKSDIKMFDAKIDDASFKLNLIPVI